MKNEFNRTGEQVTFGNGKIFNVYSKMTKRGLRYYWYSSGRMLPISKERINESIII